MTKVFASEVKLISPLSISVSRSLNNAAAALLFLTDSHQLYSKARLATR